jgi:hypothetical protein
MNFDKEWTKELVLVDPIEIFLRDDDSAPGAQHGEEAPSSPDGDVDQQGDGNKHVIRLQTKEFISNVELAEPHSVKM